MFSGPKKSISEEKKMHLFWKSRAGVNEVLLFGGTVKLQHLCLLKAKALYSIPTIHTAFMSG